MSGATFDATEFRRALGYFATGVTIVTTAHESVCVGLTASSFNSVALSPPLVLWSLSNHANCMSVFARAEHFAIHVLAADQLELSRRFAAGQGDRFQDIPWTRGVGDVPLLPDCCARFECRKTYAYEGGDHTIFVGEVLSFESLDHEPLVFQKGRYSVAKPHPAAVAVPSHSYGRHILHLLSLGYHQLNVPFRRQVEATGMSVDASKILALLSSREDSAASVRWLQEMLSDVDMALILAELTTGERVAVRRLKDGDTEVRLLTAGAQAIGPVLAAAQAVEESIRLRLGADDHAQLRRLLAALSDEIQIHSRTPCGGSSP